MKFLTVLLFTLSLISLVYSYRYTVHVELGKQDFKNFDGSIKLKVHGVHGVDTFRLLKDDIKPGRVYTRFVEMNYEIDEIDKASVYFTLTSPWKFPINKPVMYLRKITLVDQNGRQKGMALANPNTALKVKEERFLVRV